MTERLNIGIVGAGAITRSVHLPVLKNMGNVQISWISDSNQRVAKEVVDAFGLRGTAVFQQASSLPPCDVALLAVPVHAREAYLRHFAENSRAVLAEKPFAITLTEHHRYLELFGRVPVACGYMRRTYASIRSLRRMARNGWFGELRRIRYAEGGRTTRTEFGSSTLDMSHRMGGGVLRDLGCHGVDTIGFITGASGFSIDRCRIEWDGETDRHVEARFLATGIQGVTDRSCEVHYVVSWLLEQPNTIELEFERARIRCGLRPDSELSLFDESSAPAIRLGIDEPGAKSSYQAFYLEWQAVLEALRTGSDSEFTASDARSLWTTQLVEELYAAGGAE